MSLSKCCWLHYSKHCQLSTGLRLNLVADLCLRSHNQSNAFTVDIIDDVDNECNIEAEMCNLKFDISNTRHHELWILLDLAKLVENIERKTLMFKLCKTHAIVAQDPAVYSRLSLFSLTVFLSLYNWGASENMDLELLEAQYRVSREQGCCCMNCIDWIYQVS